MAGFDPMQSIDEGANFAQAMTDRAQKAAAFNALAQQYGPEAGDPERTAAVQANALNAEVNPLRVQQAQLQTDEAQRADQAAQGQHTLAFIRQQIQNGVDPAAAIGNLTPETYAALGVNPDQVGPLVDAVRQNPKVLDQIGDALAPIAAKSKLVGGVQWAQSAEGKYHALFPMQDATTGKLTYQEAGSLPEGYTLMGLTPDKAAAADAKSEAAAAKRAEYSSSLTPEDYFAAVKQVFPNAVFTGGGRTAGRNKAVGGAADSMHLSDKALDFTVPGVDSATVFSKLRAAGLPMTESLAEGQIGDQGPHLHVGWAPKESTTLAEARLKLSAAREARIASGAGGGALQPQTVSYLAQQFRTTGKLPAMGMGGAGLRAAIFNQAAQMAAAEGATGQADAYRAQATHERGTAVNDLGKSTPNSAGGRVQSANALVTHLDQLSGLSTALTSGNLPAINAARQAYMQQTGNAAPANFNAVKSIAADEAVKFIVANGGSLADRQQAQKAFNAAQSPAQLAGAIQQVQHLAAGQLAGMRQRYDAIGAASDFDATLTPRTRQILGVGQPAAAAPGASPTAALRAKYGMH